MSLNCRAISIVAQVLAMAAAVLSAGPTTTPAFLDSEVGQKVERARGLLQLLVGGNYADFAAASGANGKTLLDAETAKEKWSFVTSELGPYRTETSCKVHHSPQGWAVYVGCGFEHGRTMIMITLDNADRIVGFGIWPLWNERPYERPAYVDSGAFREETISVSAGQFPLPGKLTVPLGTTKHSAVVLIHSSGPHDEDESAGDMKPFRDLAWGLSSRGIAVLRYVKRTQQYPAAVNLEDWTLETETIDDVLAGIKLLRERPDIDEKRLFVAGISLGGFAAPFVALRDGTLAGVIVLSGNARSILDVIEDQVGYMARNFGPPYNDAEKTRKIKDALAAIRANRQDDVGSLLDYPARFLRQLHELDPIEAASRLRMPILIVQGGRDWRVTMADFALWQRGLKDRQNATFKLYKNLDHALMLPEEASPQSERRDHRHVEKEVIADIASWINGTPH